MKCDLRKVWIYIRSTSAVLTAVGVLALGGQFAQAQLEVTEIMYNPLDEDVWEWIEVRNTGGTDIDMAGWLAFNLGDGEITNPNPTIVSNTNSPNTIVPAGGVAVIYDGFHGGSSPGTFNDAPFRAAWGLDPSVPLMAGSFWPGLSNTEGSNFQSIGFWASLADYQADLVDDGSGNGTNEVGSFNNAQFSINYSDAAFPGPVNGSSMTWTGNGDNQVGGNWAVSQTGVNGATTSVEAQLVGTLNSTADIGNPGIVTASGAIPSALIISEIMYNAASNEPDWEWIEIYNNTGAAVDLSGYVLSDDDGGQLVTGNIASGTIAQGEAALFYDSSEITADQVADAWDPTGARGITFIGVDNLGSGLSNGGDSIGLWSNVTDYNTDDAAGTTDLAVAAVTYTDDPPFPLDNNAGSIYILDLSNVDIDGTTGQSSQNDGAEWQLSADGDFPGSFFAAEVEDPSGMIPFHPGGDIGSPGTFNVVTAVSADVDNSGLVDGADFLAIQRGDFPGVTIADWQAQYGTAGAAVASAGAVPEPTSLLLVGMALTLAGCVRRKA